MKTMMRVLSSKLKKANENFKNKNYVLYSIVSETLPLYHDRFQTTNKNIVKLSMDDDMVNLLTLESQDSKSIKFHKNFDEYKTKGFGVSTGSPDFQVNEMKKDVIYSVEGVGFLANENALYQVILVTDNYVYSRSLKSNSVYPYSHKEIERMKSCKALSIKNSEIQNISA